MFLIHFEKLGLYAYASTESIMTKALKKSGLWRYKYSRILLTDGDILSINKSGKTEMQSKDLFFDTGKQFSLHKTRTALYRSERSLFKMA